ncbi:MAG: aminotransferase class IV [Chitinophagaceae bacterium]|nr:aminotransferase class IV [Chitinophagaceae bacterium]
MSNEMWCNLNGHIQSSGETLFSSADDSFRLRYGIYETYLYEKGRLEYAALHWERLHKGMSLLGFTIPNHFSERFFSEQAGEMMTRNRLHDLVRIRIQVFTGDYAAPYVPQFLIEAFPLEKPMTEWLPNGIEIALLPGFQKEITEVSNCKISHNKHFIPARDMMAEQGLDDVLLLNTQGRVAESAMANLFWIRNGVVYTPPLSEGCLAGTIRAVIIACLREHRVPFEEQACSLQTLRDADELFLCNSIRKIRWVRKMEDRYYTDVMSRQLYRLLQADPVQD